mmetsp:Transcript_33125/g.79868  ORF Transcript_33125/g.79868 Transcript_33125/m.79868 type:complete len:90 (-) Transcript_33125:467-736(-)
MILSGGDHKVTLAYLERARVYIFLALGKDPSKESKIEEKSEYSAAVVKMKEQNIICNYEMASIPGYESAAKAILSTGIGTGATDAIGGA